MRTLAATSLLALLALAPLGCELNLRPGAQSLLEGFNTQASPGELAAMALDPYDPNRRYLGTLGLANEPFANQPVYIRLFLDNAKDQDPLVRSAAIRGLGTHGSAEHVPVIAAALADAVPTVRVEAARALQRVHNRDAVPALLVAMREPEAGRRLPSEPEAAVRAEAAHALGQYAEPRVLEALVAGLDDTDLSVNRSALASLRTLTGQDFGLDRTAWLGWIRQTQDPFRARSVYTYPVFNRRKRAYEFIPLVPPPPNEVVGTPAGLPRS